MIFSCFTFSPDYLLPNSLQRTDFFTFKLSCSDRQQSSHVDSSSGHVQSFRVIKIGNIYSIL